MPRRLVVRRSDPSDISAREEAAGPLADGQVRLRVDLFGLSSNNISYALYGDMLGYWDYFPVDDDHGCVPVWGFADVTESGHEQLPVGARLFGYLPMGEELVITPASITDLAVDDASPHRAGLHPWYNRYYRCDTDPVWTAGGEPMQATMWALFMTGWALANQLAETAGTVVVSSASSKTALALAWTLHHHHNDITVVGATSPRNLAFVETTGAYDHVVAYGALTPGGGGALDDVDGPAAFVDAAGSPAIRERVHAELGTRLIDSVGLGATHQGAGTATGELSGPTPRFFFIPDVAEQLAETAGRASYHADFAAAWKRFARWIDETLTVESGSGVDEITAAYRKAMVGGVGPEAARVLTW